MTRFYCMQSAMFEDLHIDTGAGRKFPLGCLNADSVLRSCVPMDELSILFYFRRNIFSNLLGIKSAANLTLECLSMVVLPFFSKDHSFSCAQNIRKEKSVKNIEMKGAKTKFIIEASQNLTTS